AVWALGVVERAVIPPVIVIAVGLLVGAVLLRSTPRAGVRTTTVAAIAFLLSNLIFAGPNLVVAASFATFAVTWASVVTGALGTIAGVASWRGRERGPAVPRVATAGVALVAVAVVVGLAASLGYSNAKPAPGDVIVRAKDSKFPATLTASSGRVSFFLDNTDNTLHD